MQTLYTIYQRSLLSLSLLASAPSGLLGQRPDETVAPGQSPVQTQLNTIKLSSRLRLHTATDRQEGRLVFRTADSLGINGEAGEIRVSRLTVDSLWVRRHHTLLGLLIGTAAGAGAYFLVTKSEEDGDVQELDNLYGAGVWAGSALVGTLVGALIPGWKRVYP